MKNDPKIDTKSEQFLFFFRKTKSAFVVRKSVLLGRGRKAVSGAPFSVLHLESFWAPS